MDAGDGRTKESKMKKAYYAKRVSGMRGTTMTSGELCCEFKTLADITSSSRNSRDGRIRQVNVIGGGTLHQDEVDGTMFILPGDLGYRE